MIVFVTETIGAPYGPSRAAVDIIGSLQASGLPVTVVSMSRYEAPNYTNGSRTDTPRWVGVPTIAVITADRPAFPD